MDQKNSQSKINVHSSRTITKTTVAESYDNMVVGSATTRQMPQKIGRYKIIEELGRGGMGVVYKAIDPQINRTVALKVLLNNTILTQEKTQRFFNEMRSIGQLNHPQIIRLYDHGQDQGIYFFTMDYIEGKTLSEILKERKLPLKKAVAIVEQVAITIHHAHTNKIIHRDLKPSNILIAKDGKAYIMDFGIAKIENNDQSITSTGAIMGTPAFMSPEQAHGEKRKIDHRTDVYSLGAILYNTITGKTCFGTTGSSVEILMKILKEEPLAPSQINNRVPKDLENICLKALAKDKDQRYDSAYLMAKDLRSFLQGKKLTQNFLVLKTKK